ncbi:hypothetical protein, partial [Natrialba taiwanensis]
AEYHLGLESEQWGYVRGDDVHGLDAENPGENACYVHCHDAIYIDLQATGLRDTFDTDHEIVAVLENTFYPAIEKHIEACDLAKPEAHTREKAIEVRLDLEEPAGYATEYLRLQEDTPMMEMPVEMQAFAAIEWAQNRQRIARSQVFNDAAKADLCLQDKERVHGHRLKYDGKGNVVCARCGSAVGIGADTIAEYRLSSQSSSDGQQAVADGGHEYVVGYRTGEPPAAAEARSQVREYVEAHGVPDSVPNVMGSLGIAPQHKQVVEEAVAGVNTAEEVEPVYGEPPEIPAEYELVEIVNPDGSIEATGGGGGGASMAELVLPEDRLLRETRLAHVSGGAKIRCEKTGFATFSAETMARYLVENCNVREPWYAEVLMSFEWPWSEDGPRDRRELPPVLDEPVARPPEDCR